MLRVSLFKDEEGEPRIYSFGFNESARKNPGAWPRHGRWFLRFPGNNIGIEWDIFTKRLGASLQFDDTDDYAVTIWFAIPFLISFYFMLGRANWLLKLLGLTYEQVRDKPLRDWRREIGFSWYWRGLWVDPWCNSNEWSSSIPRWRQSFCINFIRILFGRKTYDTYNEQVDESFVIMPEGRYPATVKRYTAEWKRPRWPFAERVHRAEVEVEGGIPVPGKGENSWDIDDDAIFSLTCVASEVREATKQMYESIMRSRYRHATVAWIPDDG